MGDFFAPPSGFAEVPADPPTPPPNFAQLGQGLGIGLQTTGALGGVLNNLFQILVQWITWLIGWVVSIALRVLAFFVNLVTNVESDASSAYGTLVSATIYNLLGVRVDPSAVSGRTTGPGRTAAAQAMGNALINALFSGVTSQTAAAITPSDAPVKQYLGTTMQIELNGWLESWFADAATYHILEKYGDLKDGIVSAMGISRMSRQAFAPLVKTFLHDPYQQLLDNTYRPKVISEGTALNAFLRGTIDQDQLDAILGPQGYSSTYQSYLVDQHRKYLPDADLEYLVSRGMWSQDQSTAYLQKQGWDPASATTILQIMQDKGLQKYRVEALSIATEAFVKGDLDPGSFQALVNSSGLTDVENSWIMSNANLKRSLHITHLSRGDIEAGILDGIMNLTDLEAWATRNGMPQNEEALLELMTLFKLNKQTQTAAAKAAAAKAKAQIAQQKASAAAAKAAQTQALAADKGVTVTQAETLVVDGLWTFEQLTAYLTAKQYGSDAIAAIVALLHAKMAKTAAATSTAATIAAGVKAKGLSLAQVQKAVLAGILTVDQLNTYLSNEGYSTSDAQVVSELTQDQLTAVQTKAAAKAAAAAAAGLKHINLPALEHAVRLALTPIDTYNAALTKAGYDDMSITLLDGILNAQIASDKATAAAKANTTVTVGGKTATLAQIGNEVVAGIRPITDYTAALAAAQYGPADQLQLTQLLQLRVTHAQKALALHSDAQGKAVAKGIDLSAAENAVLGGINTIANYTAMLQTLGYDQVDVDTLVALLQAKVAAKAAKAAAAA